MSEKNKLAEKLLYAPKNGYDRLSAEDEKAMEAYCEDYKKFLSGGCSMSPVDLLKQVGINMEEPKPIQDALDVFGKVLDEIETLI